MPPWDFPIPPEQVFIGPFTDLIGPWFWAFPLILAVALIAIRTRSFGPAYLVLVIGNLVLQPLMPGGPWSTLVFFTAIGGVVYTGYRLLVERVGR